ncbi:MAG: ABC transporter ATP-binding protein [Clostridia bacterium]|nr:ABC transporter ATP-binding protein [Clostridia bacterium]
MVLKTLAKSIREYKTASILTPVFIALEVIIECMIPWLTAEMVSAIEAEIARGGNEGLSIILKYGLWLILLAALSLTFGALSAHFCAIASCGFAKNLRHDLYASVQKFSFSNMDKFSTSGLVTRLTTDVTNVQMAYMMIIRTAVRGPLMIAVALTMAIAISPKMSLAFAVIVPFLAIGLFFIIRGAHPIFKSVFKKYDRLNESVQENVHGIRVVKAYVREDHEKKKFASASDEVAGDFTRAEKILALNNPLMQFCFNAIMLMVCFFGTRLVVTSNGSELAIPEISALLTYGAQILMSLMMLSMIIVMIVMSAASAARIAEVLNEESAIKAPETPVTEVADGSIIFKNVSFRYSEKAERASLEAINLYIASGETVGILGGTGSGKTSLIQLISRLYDVTEGAVLVGGVDVREYDLEVLRNEVSVVLQKNLLFSGSIKDNLRWGDPNASDEEMIRICKLSQADEFISRLPDGYDTHIEQGGTNVSGGQKQRLCIARALLKKPKILILDDSTSAVDTKTDALIRKAFAEEIPDTTKIIIAQRVSSVEHADKIVVLDGGRIESVGTHEELLLKSPIYREVYESQTKGGDAE